jgi:hypothetical protein
MSEADPCPSENCVPETSPGPVRNEETVVRFVEKKEHVKQDEGGSWRLVPAAVTKEELSARGGHSFSLIREAYVNNVELKARARARSCAELEGNPILARTQTERLRALTDENGRREYASTLILQPKRMTLSGPVRRTRPHFDQEIHREASRGSSGRYCAL